MSTILILLSLIVLGIHLCHRDWKSPSVFATVAVLAAGLGAHPGLAQADELAADVVAGVTVQEEVVTAEDISARAEEEDSASIQPTAEVEPAGAEVEPAGAEVEPAGEAEPGEEAEPAGKEVEPAGEEAEPADEEVEPLRDITDVRFPERTADSPTWLTTTEPWLDKADNASWVPVHIVDTSPRLAREALERLIVEKSGEEMNRVAQSARASQHIGYTIGEIRNRGIVDNEFVERVIITSGQTAYQAHALLKFDESFEEDAAGRWRKAAAMFRLMQTGGGAAFVFLLLGALFGYFKLDTATRGYYTRRLQFATAGTILAVVAASVLAAKWYVPWM